MTLSIFLCDDKPNFLSYYQKLIDDLIHVNGYQMKVAVSSEKADTIIDYLKKNQIKEGLCFLDVDLNTTYDGIDLAQTISKLSPDIKIAFLTSYSDYALEAIQSNVEPIDYIIKGNSKEREQINKILDKVSSQVIISDDALPSNFNYITLSNGTLEYKISISKIIYVETATKPHMISIIGEDFKYDFYTSLDDIQKRIPQLIQVHQSILINPANVTQIDYKNRKIFFSNKSSCFFAVRKASLLKKYF